MKLLLVTGTKNVIASHSLLFDTTHKYIWKVPARIAAESLTTFPWANTLIDTFATQCHRKCETVYARLSIWKWSLLPKRSIEMSKTLSAAPVRMSILSRNVPLENIYTHRRLMASQLSLWHSRKTGAFLSLRRFRTRIQVICANVLVTANMCYAELYALLKR